MAGSVNSYAYRFIADFFLKYVLRSDTVITRCSPCNFENAIIWGKYAIWWELQNMRYMVRSHDRYKPAWLNDLDQYVSSPGNTARWNAELTVFPSGGHILVAPTHEGMARLSRPGKLVTSITCERSSISISISKPRFSTVNCSMKMTAW